METKGKGVRTIKDIPNDILAKLNKGEIKTVNLAELCAIDRKVLFSNLLKSMVEQNI